MNAKESAGESQPTTLYEKIFRSHIVREDEDSSLRARPKTWLY